WTDKATATVSATWVHGNHTFKSGADFKSDNYTSAYSQFTMGVYNFSAAETALPYLQTRREGRIDGRHFTPHRRRNARKVRRADRDVEQKHHRLVEREKDLRDHAGIELRVAQVGEHSDYHSGLRDFQRAADRFALV